jgi:DNA invertase Pin-like site-specific DNA recombinase
MARIGYARVSSIDQDLEGQLERLKAEGCGVIRSEKVSGASRDGRRELETIIEFLRGGRRAARHTLRPARARCSRRTQHCARLRQDRGNTGCQRCMRQTDVVHQENGCSLEGLAESRIIGDA